MKDSFANMEDVLRYLENLRDKDPLQSPQTDPLTEEPKTEPDLRLLASSPEATIEDLLQCAEDFPSEVLQNPALPCIQETDPERYREIICAAWISLGEASLAEGISSLSPHHQMLFLLRCVERVLPLYQTLYKDKKNLQHFSEAEESFRFRPAQPGNNTHANTDRLPGSVIGKGEVLVRKLADGSLLIEKYASYLEEISDIFAEFQEHKQLEDSLLEQAARQAAIALLSSLCFVCSAAIVYVGDTIEAIMSAIYLQSLASGKSQEEARNDVLTELEEQKKIITSLLG
jgi:hypothetical protein